jgi:hypothetical protein
VPIYTGLPPGMIFAVLVIRDQQMEALADARERGFLARLTDRVRLALAERRRPLSEERLAQFVATSVAAARAHAITRETAVVDFLGLCIDCGPEFHRHPEVSRILADESLLPDERVGAIFRRLPPSAWVELSATADGG